MTELCLDASLDAEQRDYLNDVRSSATHRLGVINDILDFSKIEAGKLTLEVEPFVSLNECERLLERSPLKRRARDSG